MYTSTILCSAIEYSTVRVYPRSRLWVRRNGREAGDKSGEEGVWVLGTLFAVSSDRVKRFVGKSQALTSEPLQACSICKPELLGISCVGSVFT